MKRVLTIILCAIYMVRPELYAQIPPSAENDTVSNRQDPNAPDPFDPDPGIPTIVGDALDLPFVVGSQSQDFSYTDTRNTKTFYNLYEGLETKDVFYRFTLTVPMNVTMTHQGSSVADTYMYLLASDGTLITSNDDYDGDDHCTNIQQSFIRRQLAAGTYYVVSEGYSSDGFITTNITGNISSSFNYPVFPSTYSSDPNTAVGGMGGQFGVSPLGGATYSIPIEVPQGVGGLQPQLSIVYNSQSGNGLCGYGTSLAGISSITRGPKDIYHDGTAQGISYLADDALYLDGERLILFSGTAGQDSTVYIPESDPYTRVIAHGTCTSTSNNTWYEVQQSDGMVYWYGCGNTSRQSYKDNDGKQKIHAWYLDRVIHRNGNYLEHYYDTIDNCVYLILIAYGSNLNNQGYLSNNVLFSYETSNGIPIHFDDQHGSLSKRLKAITCTSNDAVYRTYTLNYDNTTDGTKYKYSRLKSVTEKNGYGESLPATRFNWSYLPSLSYQSTGLSVVTPITPGNVSLPFGNQIYVSGDLNNDGLDDIAGLSMGVTVNGQVKSYLSIYWAECLNSSVSYSDVTLFEMPNVFSNTLFIDRDMGDFHSFFNGSAIVDWNGDGYNEVLLPFYVNESGNRTMRFYLQGCDSTGESCWDEVVSCPLNTNGGSLYSVADLNNDGRKDIMVLEKSSSGGSYTCRLLSYDAESPYHYRIETIQLSLPSTPGHVYLSDLNGNGLNDMLIICDDDYAVYWNQGGNVISSSMFSDSYKLNESTMGCYHRLITAGDFNGDGLLDILINGFGTDLWYFNLNNGDGSFSQLLACNLDVTNRVFTDRDDDKIHFDVLDFDGDGKSDLIVTAAKYNRASDITGSWGVFDKTYTYWMRSDGVSLEEMYYATSNREEDAMTNRFVIGDYNGDGLKELANYGYDCVNGTDANNSPVWRLCRYNGYTTQTGKVTSVTGDFGVTTSITYTTLTDDNVYTRGTPEPYPAPRYTIPLNVVKQTVQSNGAAGSLTTQYSYEGLKVHLKGRGLLGFSKTTAVCTTTGVITESGITQWDTAHYIPKVTYSKSTIGNSCAQTVSTLTVLDKGQKKYYAYPSQIVSTDMDGNTVTTVYSYNTTCGYPLSETSTYGTNMYCSTAYADYVRAGGSYRPQTVTVSRRHPDDTSPFSVTTAYTYDSITGTVASKVDNYGTTKPLTTQYTYDLWGNLTSQVSTGSGITTPCTTYYSYESTHRFPVRIYTNPSSSVMKYTYDVWGNVLSEQDSINASISNTVIHTYDGWNQITGTTRPDGTQTTYTRGWSSDAGCRYYTLTQGTATPWVKTWYDNCGRQVSTLSVGPHDVTSGSTTVYDSNGQVTSHTETEGNLTLTSNYTYDARGRLKTESYTGDRTVTYSYGNHTVTVTENHDRNTVKTYDAWGNLQTLSNYTSYLTNTYSSNGGIKQTVSGGPTWTFTYDDRGNRISMTDPDAGTTTYVYDALGRETSRTDGRGVVFVTEYDYLGRVMQRSAGSEVTSYTYGASGYGQSRLISESNGSWTKSYEYDNLGRVTSETMSDGTHISKSKAYTYGSNGLLSSRLLPGGKGYSYTYDSYGNLVGVDFDSGTIEWNLTGYTGNRTVSRTVLDGSTSHPFIKEIILDGNGLLDSITTSQDNSYYQADDYGFSAQTGNLTYRKNNSSYYPQTYSYDQADRLTAVCQNNQTIQSMTYSYTGNITSKTGIGEYDYSTIRPHAVMGVDNTSGIIETDEQYITYNPWGKVSAVLHSDGTDSYSYSIGYGPDQQRITSSMSKNNSLQYETFYWDDYEEKKVGNVLYRYYYVYGANGLEGLHVVKTSPNNQATTHTTKVLTDHLGSIMSLIDNYDWAYDVTFDAWGKRDLSMPYWFEPGFNRGFTGHEHLDEMGLINMNGRMYDPDLGRFLSPDPFIQSPSNPQNYNRYSYCLNNPLKYTDPSGEIFGTLLGLISDVIDNIGRTFKWEKWDWTQTKYGWEIDKGLFMTDPNKSTKGRFKEFFSRITNQVVQTVCTDLYVSVMNAFGKVNGVTHGYGVTAVDMGLKRGAVTPSYISIGPKGYKADWRDHMFVHEYGHYLQSQELGIKYLYMVCLPSLQSAIIDTDKNNAPNHNNRWFETDANRRSAEYFDKYYGSGRDDYDSNSSDFFDINSFRYGTESKYLNPRKGDHNKYPAGHPFEPTSHWTDLFVALPFIGLLPYFLYK